MVVLQASFLGEPVSLLVFPLSSAVEEELVFLYASFSPSSKIGLPTSVTREVSMSDL